MTDTNKKVISSNTSFDSLASIHFKVDPFWPKQLPNSWILGEVPGIAIDEKDHIWLFQRPNSLDERELITTTNYPEKECCTQAPSVLELNPEGKVVNTWDIYKMEDGLQTDELWEGSPHGIYIDANEYVWVTNAKGHTVLKFTKDGKCLLQIGKDGETNGSNDIQLLGGPADIAVDTEAKEVYIADGYVNRRVIVFDSETGAYKRHWGGYGKIPHDDELPASTQPNEPVPSFRTAVHAVSISKEGHVYVADRTHNRIQVFQKDGTFIRETFIARGGSVWDIAFSRDNNQSYVYVADGANMKVWILDKTNLDVVNSFGFGGRNAGQFGWIHNLTVDSKGNIYTSEVRPGKRIQKFVPVIGE